MASQRICRCCAKVESTSTLLTYLFGKEAETLDLRVKINKYTPIEVNENDNLPKSICGECKYIIIKWHMFWEQCSKTDTKLKLMFQNCKENETQYSVPVSPVEKEVEVSSETKPPASKVHTLGQKGFYCIAKWCNNNNVTSRMFRLPKDARCQTWLRLAGREDLKDLNIKKLHNKYLCQKHFTDDMFTNSNKKYLITSAMPSLFESRVPRTATKSAVSEFEPNTYGKRFRPLIAKNEEMVKRCMGNEDKLKTDEILGNITVSEVESSSSIQEFLVFPSSGKHKYLSKVTTNKKNVNQKSILKRNISTEQPVAKLQSGGIVKSLQVEEGPKTKKDTHVNDSNTQGETSAQLQSQVIAMQVTKNNPLRNAESTVENSLEYFKVSDVDYQCSGQGFRESMQRCDACGEVFLMISSLVQHCNMYHGEQFDCNIVNS